jgi:hypothetical protein
MIATGWLAQLRGRRTHSRKTQMSSPGRVPFVSGIQLRPAPISINRDRAGLDRPDLCRKTIWPAAIGPIPADRDRPDLRQQGSAGASVGRDHTELC